MHFFDGFDGPNKLAPKDAQKLMDHMIVLRETPALTQDELMSEDVRPKYECMMMGKTAARITQENFKTEGRVSDLLEINMMLMNMNRTDEVILMQEGKSAQMLK